MLAPPTEHTILESLKEFAHRLPEKVALQDDRISLTFKNWLDQAQSFSAYLTHTKTPQFGRILIMLENCVEFGPIVFGTLMSGCAFVPINPQMKSERLRHIIEDCKPSIIICNRTNVNEIPTDYKSQALIHEPGSADVEDIKTLETALCFNQRFEQPIVLGSDLSSLIYTSGSTGNPKGVMHTLRSTSFACRSICQYLELDERHKILCTLPFSFDYGLYQLLFSASTGCFLYISKGFTYPQQVQDLIDSHNINVLPAVPTTFQLLSPLWQKQQPLIEILTSTGEDLPPTLIESLRKACQNAKVFKMYGLTECKRVSYLPPEKVTTKPESVGKAIPGTRVLLLDDNLEPVNQGDKGTLYVQGEHLMQGYWNHPELTAKTLVHHPKSKTKMLCTGDSFIMDEDGDLIFAERNDDSLKIKGIKVSPSEIEKVINRHPDVQTCAVTYQELPRLGKQLVAFVVSEEPPSEQSLAKLCRSELETHLQPRKFIFIDQIPVTANGKLDRKALAEHSS